MVGAFFQVVLLVVASARSDARATLDAFLKEPDVPGEHFTQARDFDGFAYREVLGRALHDPKALAEILEYSGRASLIGAGAENHAIILKALVVVWGDRAFAKALQSCSSKAVTSVLEYLEYSGVDKAAFPRTFAAGASSMVPN